MSAKKVYHKLSWANFLPLTIVCTAAVNN